MDLIVNQMMQLKIMHVSDRNRAVEILSGTSVAETHFTVSGNGHTLPKLSVSLIFIQILHNIGAVVEKAPKVEGRSMTMFLSEKR